MIVTKISPQKRDPYKFNIFIDGEYRFALNGEDIAFFQLKEEKDIPRDTVEYIETSLVYIKAQDTALNYIGYKMRTAYEVKKKLEEKGFSEEICAKVMEFTDKYGYTNDREYAKGYIKERLRLSPRSRYALEAELRQRGIDREICAQALGETEISEVEDAVGWIRKKAKSIEIMDEKKKKQIIGFLQRKGYSYGVIKDAFSIFEKKE